MKNLILILTATFLLIGCKDEAPTDKSDDQIQTEYTLEELENDPDWVEVTDIDTLDLPCIWLDLFERGKLIKQENEYKDMYNESKALMNHSKMPYCKNDTDNINLDFSRRDLILYEIRSNGGKPKFKRKIFKNLNLNECRYVLELTITSGTEENSGFTEVVSIPKISDSMNMVFDTLRYYNN